MSLLVEMQNGVRISSCSLTFIQLSGILKRRRAGRALEGTAQIRDRFDGSAVFDPSLYGTVIEAQREGRIGIYISCRRP